MEDQVERGIMEEERLEEVNKIARARWLRINLSR